MGIPDPTRRLSVNARKLNLAACAAVLAFAALPATAGADTDVDVCNEAENSWHGGYVVTDGPVDPNPPAFLRGSQMRVGDGNGEGLAVAAEQSPALRVCGPEDVDPTDPTDPTDPGEGGGDPIQVS
jgi:hypothetical protein